ncbi:MAG: redoxin domain-containing protein [Planctomycetaceae bacterium]
MSLNFSSTNQSLALLLTLALTGCGGDSAAPSPQSQTPAAAEPVDGGRTTTASAGDLPDVVAANDAGSNDSPAPVGTAAASVSTAEDAAGEWSTDSTPVPLPPQTFAANDGESAFSPLPAAKADAAIEAGPEWKEGRNSVAALDDAIPFAEEPESQSGVALTNFTTTSPDSAGDIPFAAEGTPEWRLYEIARLMTPPATQVRVVSADGAEQVTNRPSNEITAERIRNLKQAVTHAGQAIAATLNDPSRESLFTNAVHYLSAAHRELAILGESEHARRLAEVAEAMFVAKPESAAAAASAAQLVELARGMALLYGEQNDEWVRAHANQARLFAERFPNETSRASVALLEAGRTCERFQLEKEARDCYLLLKDRYADTPFAEDVQSVLRRMSLVGKTLNSQDFGGPTIDGGFISIEQYRDRHTLVVFWSSGSPTFAEDIAKLQKWQAEAGQSAAIIGVNLDQDEGAVDQFLESHPLVWRQVFSADPEQRGTYNPVAAHYGVVTVPHYWLVDPSGKVLRVGTSFDELQLGRSGASTSAAP